MKRLIIMLGLIGIFGMSVISQASARTYTIMHMSHVAWTSGDVAYAKGFFKKNGVDVKMAVFQTATEVINAIKNKRGEFYFANLPAVMSAMANDTVYLGGFILWGGGYQLVLNKSLVGKNLEGQTVANLGNDPAGMVVLDNYFKRMNFDKSKIRIITMGNDVLLKNFTSGRIKAAVLQERSLEKALAAGGVVVERTPLISVGLGSYMDTLKDIPQKDIEGIIRGWMEARQWSDKPENWKEVKQIMDDITFRNMPKLSDVDAQTELKNIRPYNAKELLEFNQGLDAIELTGDLLKHMKREDITNTKAAISVLKKMK